MTIFLMGQFEIARFKNINVIQNNLSDKQLNKMQANLAEQYPVVCQKINENILGIVKEVNKYLPTDILLYAFMEMAVNHINIESEVEIEEDGVLAYRMLDYLQSIIASVPTVEGNKQELTDNRWNKLKELVGSLYYLLNQDYHICQTAYKRTQQPDIDIECYKFEGSAR